MSRLTRLGLAAAALALALPLRAQTVYGLDSMGGGGLPVAFEFTGPPGPCGYPGGPFGLPPFPAGPGACPSTGPFFTGAPGGFDGDIAVDHLKDSVWIGTPMAVAEYTTGGVQIAGFFNPMPGAITGLGCDSAAGTLWMSDGFTYVNVAPACGGVPFALAGPFPEPLGTGVPMTDIAWDPTTATLWACYADGTVINFMPGGPILCGFPTAGLLPPPLTGLDIDTTTPGLTSPGLCAVITNGPMIARVDLTASCGFGGAALAPPNFAFPAPMWPAASGPLSGIAFADHAVTYGVGSGPAIGFTGQAVYGTANAVTLTGAPPGTAGLFVDFAALCPPGVFKGLPLYVLPTLVVGPIAHAGAVTIPVPITPALPLGAEVHLQWYSRATPGGGFPLWSNTPGMLLTIGAP